MWYEACFISLEHFQHVKDSTDEAWEGNCEFAFTTEHKV